VDLSGGVKVRVIAGHFGPTSGAVTDIYADPTYLDVSLPAEAKFSHTISADHTAFAYLFRGDASFSTSSNPVEAPRLVIFGDGDTIEIKTLSSGARFLLVSGLPLGEPIARYGPFVMNTQAEIQQALAELRSGTFIKALSGEL
jgi:redox-sensitive bicupin YhaK (pirin superfamily)